jgi:penicillin amidase
MESLLPPQIASAYLAHGPSFVTLMRALRERPRGWFAGDDRDAFLREEFKAAVHVYGSADVLAKPYGEAYASVTKHPLAAFGLQWWNGPRIPGSGGSYAPAVLTPTFSQSFRAVWDVGNWDAGGIDIPLGESGEPGSPHYTDLSKRYTKHELTPLPFSDAAITKAAQATQTLAP